MARILILGGGFGGLAAAHELRNLLPSDDEVVVVDRRDHFAMGFAKLWELFDIRPLAQGTRNLRQLDDRGIRYERADIGGIDPVTRTVETTAGAISADALLVALGADDDARSVTWLRGAAHNLYDAGSLPAIRRDLERLEAGRVVVAILGLPPKCPPAPFEAALLLDEWLRTRGRRDAVEVLVSTPQSLALPVAGVDASAYIARSLEEHGVTLLSEHAVEGVDADRRRLRFANGRDLDYDLLLGVPASTPPGVLAASDLAGPDGWVQPDPRTLRTAYEAVYAVGDCTRVPTANAALPKAGVFAAGEAVVAARNIVADLHGGEPAAFDGHGFCYLEFPGRRVAMVEGDFYAEPKPDVRLTPPEESAFADKQSFERERLAQWLG